MFLKYSLLFTNQNCQRLLRMVEQVRESSSVELCGPHVAISPATTMLRSSDFDAHSSALIELMAKDVKHDAELTKAATTIAALREHKEQHAQQLAGLGAGLR